MSGPERRTHQGRQVISRAELARVTGEREHTLYKWHAARARNGHPDGVVLDGCWFIDEQEWRLWRETYAADRRIIDGRTMVTPAELARVTGEPEPTLARWYRDRGRNGHPEGLLRDKRRYVDKDEWETWYARHKAGLRTGLTQVDRSGDPNELISVADTARVLGYSGPATVNSYIGRGQFIEPDHTEALPSGRIRRWYRRRRIWEFADRRTWSRMPDRRTGSQSTAVVDPST